MPDKPMTDEISKLWDDVAPTIRVMLRRRVEELEHRIMYGLPDDERARLAKCDRIIEQDGQD